LELHFAVFYFFIFIYLTLCTHKGKYRAMNTV
jgi:hypothetical protein